MKNIRTIVALSLTLAFAFALLTSPAILADPATGKSQQVSFGALSYTVSVELPANFKVFASKADEQRVTRVWWNENPQEPAMIAIMLVAPTEKSVTMQFCRTLEADGLQKDGLKIGPWAKSSFPAGDFETINFQGQSKEQQARVDGFAYVGLLNGKYVRIVGKTVGPQPRSNLEALRSIVRTVTFKN